MTLHNCFDANKTSINKMIPSNPGKVVLSKTVPSKICCDPLHPRCKRMKEQTEESRQYCCYVSSGWENNNLKPLFYVSFSKFEKKTKKGFPGSFRGRTNGLRVLFNPFRLGQVWIEIKSSKIEPPVFPINSLASFGRKFEGTFFGGRTLSLPIYLPSLVCTWTVPIDVMMMWLTWKMVPSN